MLANHVFWRLMHFYTPLLLLLQPSVQWLSIVNFNNDAKPPPKWILREFDVSRIGPRLGGLPHLETFTWQNLTPVERVTRSSRPGYPPWRVTPPIICKRDQKLWLNVIKSCVARLIWPFFWWLLVFSCGNFAKQRTTIWGTNMELQRLHLLFSWTQRRTDLPANGQTSMLCIQWSSLLCVILSR